MIESRTAAALSVSTSRVSRGLAQPTHSVWHVFTEVGTQVMTLGALETALRRGDVSLSTLVWIPGMAEWEPLGEVANLQNTSLAAPGPRRASGIHVATRQGRSEREQPVCNCARSTGPSAADASREAVLAPTTKGVRARRKRSLLDRDSLRRSRLATTLLAALLLMLLGGWRLAEAVAHQHQRLTAPGPTPPAEPLRP